MANEIIQGGAKIHAQIEDIKATLLRRIEVLDSALAMTWPGERVECRLEADHHVVLSGRQGMHQWWLELELVPGLGIHSLPIQKLWLHHQVEAGAEMESVHFAINESGLHDAREWLAQWLATD